MEAIIKEDANSKEITPKKISFDSIYMTLNDMSASVDRIENRFSILRSMLHEDTFNLSTNVMVDDYRKVEEEKRTLRTFKELSDFLQPSQKYLHDSLKVTARSRRLAQRYAKPSIIKRKRKRNSEVKRKSHDIPQKISTTGKGRRRHQFHYIKN